MASPRQASQLERSAAIPTRFTRRELARIERARALVGLPSRSRFIRQSVLDKLEEIEATGIVQLRDVSVDEAMKLIDKFLRAHPGVHYVSDLIEGLGLEPRIAFAASQNLIERGLARVRRQ